MKKHSIALVLVFACFVSMLQAQNVQFFKSNFPDKPKEFREAKNNFSQGNKYYDQGPGMYMTALEYFLKAQAFNPNCAELNYKIGKCYLGSIQKTNAIEFLERSIELDPMVGATGKDISDVQYLLGQAYHSNLDFDKAIDALHAYRRLLTPAQVAELGPVLDKRIANCEVGKELVKKPVRVFIDNLGEVVNSRYREYSPLITADESTLFFTSRRPNTTGGKRDPNDLIYYEDIYISEKDVNGNWLPPQNPPKPLNGKKHDATVGLSPDGQTLLVYKGSNGGDIYESKLKGDKWTKPVRLPKTINTPHHESSATFSPDGRTLYFVSDRPDGYGGGDIWMSKKDKKGKWGPAVNLGPSINSRESEEGVFMHPNGKTLYFSSRGHSSMGGYDIFKSTIEKGIWSTPENLGYPINTADDDVFFSISASGIHGYYSSVKPGGFGDQDLYMITFLGDEKPLINNTEDNLLASVAAPVSETVIEPTIEIKENQLTLLKGIVMDEVTLLPLGSVIELTDNDLNEIIASFESNSKTGRYLITLPSGKNYGMAVKADGYLFHSENFNIPPTTSYREVNKDILMKKVAVGSTIVLNNIFFDFDKSTIRPESHAELDRLLNLLTSMSSMKIEISGHTDNIGSSAYNKRLSEARAKAVVDYLIGKGIKSDRLTFVGHGFDLPIATNDTEEGRQMNRRTEFKILSR
jgi:outer membrane protein OmpA-like peptidoglycan-associated protein/tetratricopeptide (TPR) repeat protein